MIGDKVAQKEQFERDKRVSRKNESDEVKLIRKIILEESQKQEKKENEIMPDWKSSA